MAQSSKPKYSNVLMVRFSAIGDVAMTVPVIQSLAQAYPDVRFTMLSNARFAPFFEHMPDNVTFMGVDLKKDYHGFGAMLKLLLPAQSFAERVPHLDDAGYRGEPLRDLAASPPVQWATQVRRAAR